MAISSYKDLIMWQKSFLVTKAIVILFRKIPGSVELNIFKHQIIRSSASVGANMAEGFGRYGRKEFSRYLQISLGSANETEYWLLLLKDLYSGFQSDINSILEVNNEIIKMLATSIKTIHTK